MRIVICDDHRLLLEALTHALSLEGFTIEAATSDPHEAVQAVCLYDPDVLLVDLTFPDSDGDGLTVAREVAAVHPRTKVVILTASDEHAPLLEAMRIGVSGYIRKDERMSVIVSTLQRAVEGLPTMDAALTRRLSVAVPQQRRRSILDGLTEQERTVLGHLGQGLRTSEIVAEMGISNSTVRSHVQSILSKLGVHSRLQAVASLHAEVDTREAAVGLR